MLFSEFLAGIRESLKQYDSAGLINDMTVYDLVIDGLNKFSILPSIKIETIINIKNNKGKLPDGFKSIYSAIKCEPFVYTTEDNSPDILQDIYFYKVRELVNTDWNFCEPCELTETDTCVVEKLYLHNGTKANFYYHNLQPLKLNLTPYVKKTICDKDCVNFSVKQSPYEISINNKTIYTNFDKGNIFLVYNGYEEDDDGFVIIPETDQGWLKEYLVNMVKRNIIENVLANSDNTTNEQFLYTLYLQKENDAFIKAMGEMKLKRVLYGIEHYKHKVKRELSVYNFGTYSHNHIGNRTEFIVL